MKQTREKTYLARFLNKLVVSHSVTPKELASRLGIVKSHLSHIFSGSRRSFNYETVAKMVEGISDDPEVQGELLKNYLLDQCTDNNRPLIHIQVTGGKEQDAAAANRGREDGAKSPDPVDRFCSHLRHLNIKEETLDVFRRLLDQAENSAAMQKALAHLADVEIPSGRRKR